MSLKKFVNKKKFPDIKKILNKIKISSFAGKIENAENPSHFVTKSETARWRKKNETSRHDKKKKDEISRASRVLPRYGIEN